MESRCSDPPGEKQPSLTEVMFGKPVIKGTRITVEHVLRKLGAGMSAEEIVEEHSHISVQDIRAAEAFGS